MLSIRLFRGFPRPESCCTRRFFPKLEFALRFQRPGRPARSSHPPAKKTWLGSPLAQRFSRPCVGCGLPQRVWGPATARCRNHPPPPGWSGGGRTNAPRDHGRSGRRRRKEVTLARPRTRLRGWGPAGGQSVLTAGRGPHLQVSGSPERISLPPNRGERREVMDRSSGRRATARGVPTLVARCFVDFGLFAGGGVGEGFAADVRAWWRRRCRRCVRPCCR